MPFFKYIYTHNNAPLLAFTRSHRETILLSFLCIYAHIINLNIFIELFFYFSQTTDVILIVTDELNIRKFGPNSDVHILLTRF